MTNRPRVVVLGDSLLVEGVAVSLAKCQQFSLIRIDPAIFDNWQRINFLDPDVIVFELDKPQSSFLLSLLKERPGIMLIGLDVDFNRVIVLNSRQQFTRTVRDLCQIVEAEVGDQLQLSFEEELANSLLIASSETFPTASR